jgi:hypothetical protein
LPSDGPSLVPSDMSAVVAFRMRRLLSTSDKKRFYSPIFAAIDFRQGFP